MKYPFAYFFLVFHHNPYITHIYNVGEEEQGLDFDLVKHINFSIFVLRIISPISS